MENLNAIAGAAGVLIAVAAFIYSIVQSRKLAEASLRERRAEFELGLLAEMCRQWATSRTYSHLTGHLQALLASGSEELPITRDLVGVNQDDVSRLAVSRVRQEVASANTGEPRAVDAALADALVGELRAAIARRVSGPI